MNKSKILWRDSYFLKIITLLFFGTGIIILDWAIFESYTPPAQNDVVLFLFSLPILFLMGREYDLIKIKVKRGNVTFLVFLLVMISLAILGFLIPPLPFLYWIYQITPFLLLNGLFILNIYNNLRLKFSYITKNGVGIGTAYPNHEKDFILQRKFEFILWTDIKEIKLAERQQAAGYIAKLMCYLTVKTQDNSKLVCFIKNYKGFETIIKKLGKEKLLIKDFKYSQLRDKDIPFEEKEKLCEELEKKEPILD